MQNLFLMQLVSQGSMQKLCLPSRTSDYHLENAAADSADVNAERCHLQVRDDRLQRKSPQMIPAAP